MDEDHDPAFHFEIWRGPDEAFGDEAKAIYYVENHNGQCGYGELATDFEMAARQIIAAYRTTQLANWMAPVAHLSRQTIELCLKALVESIRERDAKISAKPLRQHDLKALWSTGTQWLDSHGYQASEDARRPAAEHLIDAFHSIDPSGDLFRFGMSRKTAFGKQKSYDRVGIMLERFEREFDAAVGFLSHWEAVVRRLSLAEDFGHELDGQFDANNFPRTRDKPVVA